LHYKAQVLTFDSHSTNLRTKSTDRKCLETEGWVHYEPPTGIEQSKSFYMKKVYNVSYDLNKAGKDYKGLHDELKSTSGYFHLLDSTWLLHTSESANQIWERLKKHVDSDDRILVAQITSNKQGWLSKTAWEWLDARLLQSI